MEKQLLSSTVVLFLALGYGSPSLFNNFSNGSGSNLPKYNAPIYEPLKLHPQSNQYKLNLEALPEKLTPRYLWRTFKNSV